MRKNKKGYEFIILLHCMRLREGDVELPREIWCVYGERVSDVCVGLYDRGLDLRKSY